MKCFLFINPLRPGKLEEYKEFAAEITGSRRKEYDDLLKRYHFKKTEVWIHKLGDIDYVIVRHEVENDIADPLASWSTSTHPFDQWFQQQLNRFHDMEGVIPPNLLFALK
jgi:hypothetical protein